MEGNADNALAAALAVRLQGLSDMEIAHLNLGINWGDGKSREHCEDQPWFDQISDLFTENGGQEIHDQTRDAIARVVNLRLSR